MLTFALISLALSLSQTGEVGPVSSIAQLYSAPVVRPFEPPSNFGRVTGEGDADGGTVRRPLVAPVIVEAYRGSYEHAPTGSDTAYDDGVADAERAMDARMGPLDGRWRLRDVEGRLLATLSLVDRGQGPLEGAFRTADAAAKVGPLDVAEHTAGTLVMDLGGDRVSLSASAEGWTGALVAQGRRQAVTLSR